MTAPIEVTRLAREALNERAPALARIHADAFAGSAMRAWTADEIAELAERETCVVFAAAQGFLALDKVADEGDILSFAVAPAFQRKGVGSRILCRALDWLRETGVRRCILEVAADNHAAILLYRRAGFLPIARRFGYYPVKSGQIDAIVMENLLTA